MNSTTLESFINFCDNIMIVEEGLLGKAMSFLKNKKNAEEVSSIRDIIANHHSTEPVEYKGVKLFFAMKEKSDEIEKIFNSIMSKKSDIEKVSQQKIG